MARLLSLLFATGLICLAGSSFGQEVELDFAAVRETNQLKLSSGGDEVEIVTQGQDPYLWIQIPQLQRDVSVWVWEIEYFCTSGIGGPQLRLGKPARAEGYLTLPSIPPAEGWTLYTTKVEGLAEFASRRNNRPFLRLDLGRRSDVRLRIRRAILRPMNRRELDQEANAERVRLEKEQKAAKLLQAWTGEHVAKIEQVTIDGDNIVIHGRANATANLQLRARSIADHESDPRWLVQTKINFDAGSTFRIKVNRKTLAETPSGLIAWQVFQGDASQSAIHYSPVNHTKEAARLSPLPPRKSKKGFTGLRTEVTEEQLQELAIQHGTVNMVLNGLVVREEKTGWIPFKSLGRTWWASPPRLKGTDRAVREATDAGVQIAATLLIRPGKDDLVHPEYDAAGHYSMANLTRRESSELYIATLDFLAERYARPDSQFGRIDHWIVHNEVDYGWQWTNMGTQPIELFMDHYARSMRIVDAITRRHNPHARTFISLTHRWNVADNMPWKTYAPKRMLELLLTISKREGNFLWGVAYHPYPQSLWDARTWDDHKIDLTFDTELITIKNLTVLDRFITQPDLLYDGEARPVICSEQGFHAPATQPDLLERQCAALVYTWLQLDKCKSILAFDYHRPIDHPREGGLQLGLRGFKSQEHPMGLAKPGWEVYRQLGTDAQQGLVEQYEKYWTDSSTN
ncbi:MAG: DUF5722 domain-containing protein [Aureliella sp.]